ncbi:MAG TPA: hypothetical protein VJ831_01755 [Jatrophihabitantaceae bacterium]|nr:hypothetical protein [Jatrophihabitantaceae bacterium]
MVWLGGLVVGFFGVLSVAARYGCANSAHGLACRKSGSALGVLIVLGVVAIVTAVTVATHNRAPRTVLIAATVAVAALLACYLAAHALLATA